jgi:hypothetical protein
MPAGAVIPVLSCPDVGAATSFLAAAFGFRVRW